MPRMTALHMLRSYPTSTKCSTPANSVSWKSTCCDGGEALEHSREPPLSWRSIRTAGACREE